MTPMTNSQRLPQGFGRVMKDPVRLTALLYLREALLAEKYEDCAEIIAIAVEFGALPGEVASLLEDPRRLPIGIKRNPTAKGE